MNLIDFVTDTCKSGEIVVTDAMLAWLSSSQSETVQNEFVLFCANNKLIPDITAYERYAPNPPELQALSPITGDNVAIVLLALAKTNPVFTTFVNTILGRLLA